MTVAHYSGGSWGSGLVTQYRGFTKGEVLSKGAQKARSWLMGIGAISQTKKEG